LGAADQLISKLRKEVNPLISKLQGLIEETTKELRLPENVNLEYDQTLEKSSLRLVLKAANQEELERALKALNEGLEDKNWEKLFEILTRQAE
ncbi:MAG: hypothetical protein ACPLRA_07570, partial [Candidatus Saccharicenans sp.]